MKGETSFEKRYKSLNKAQKEAVDAIDGPVMVIAGPGTGKTTVLTLRIANILKQTDTPASGILALTYTDSGVRAMRQKLTELIGNRSHEIEIHTFHSFASMIINQYPDHFTHLQGLKQMTDVEQEMLIRLILSEKKFKDLRPAARPDAYLSNILRAIDEAKRDALTPKALREFAEAEAERIKNDESSLSTRGATKGKLKAEAEERIEKCGKTILLSEVYEKYEEEKRAKKLMDYNDLIIELLLALKNDELLLRLVQERFLYLVVDEHQDTNDAQNLILALIAEFFETPNLFIVGDEKQAIYRFQGASVENFLKLRKKWPAMKLVSLDTNYRSHQGLLDASFSVIENNYAEDESRDLRVKLKAGSDEAVRPVEVITGDNTAASEEYLVKELKALIKKEPEATVAIITRRNRDLERAIRLLESHNIPVSSERSVDIFHHPVGALFFDLIQYLVDPRRLDALSQTVVTGLWGLNFEKAVALVKELRAGKESDLEKKLPALKKIRAKMLEDLGVGFVVEAADLSGFTELVSRDPVYIHVWRGIMSLAESIARDSRIYNPQKLLEAMLAYRESAESRTVKVSVGAPDHMVKAMTAHGSKGLEFDYVFLPYATDESWIGRSRGTSFVLPLKSTNDGDIRDVRRLFYVALTRARRHAAILTSHEESDGRELTELRFVGELAPELVSRTALPRAHVSLGSGSSNLRKSDKVVSLAKNTLLSTGLSVTALNHFLECPNQFIYESVFKMPQAPSIPAEKGNAMHAAIAKIWSSEDRGMKKIEEIIIETTGEFLDASLLSVIDKEVIKEELRENAPEVARALASHFGFEGMIESEKWYRAAFGFVHNGEHFTIPIHGKLDAVLKNGFNAQVFDYKTRQGMSVAEIKGETKSSNGNYFRQLVFYRLLTNADTKLRGSKLSYSLIFVSPDKKGQCPTVTLPVEKADEKKVEENINTLLESVWSGGIANATCGKHYCEYCAKRNILTEA